VAGSEVVGMWNINNGGESYQYDVSKNC